MAYNTGTTATANNAADVQFTVPDGVLVDDVMLLSVECACTDSTAPALSFSGGGGTWELVPMTDGSANPQVAVNGGNYAYGWAYQRVATAADIGATVTITETGASAGTLYWAVAMAAYTGANPQNPVDRAGSAEQYASSGPSSITCPSETARIAGDWAVFMHAGFENAGAVITGPSGSTQRQNLISSAGAGAGIWDSNGTTGLNSVGGGTFSDSSGSGAWLTAFTICLAPAGVYVVQTGFSPGGTYAGNFGSNVTPGNSIVLIASGYNTGYGTTPVSSNPTFNGSPVSGASQVIPDTWNNTCGGTAWLLPNVSGDATSIALNVLRYSNNSVNGIWFMEVAGLGTEPSLDKYVINSPNNSDTASFTTPDITNSPELIVGVYIQDNGGPDSGPGSGWIGPQGDWGGSLNASSFYQIATSSGGAYNMSWVNDSSNTNWTGFIFTLQPGSLSSNVAGGVANVAVAAPYGTPNVVTPGPPTPNVLVAAPVGSAASVIGTQLSTRVACSFQGHKSVTATSATIEFEAGQPVQFGLSTLASDRWLPMYPG